MNLFSFAQVTKSCLYVSIVQITCFSKLLCEKVQNICKSIEKNNKKVQNIYLKKRASTELSPLNSMIMNIFHKAFIRHGHVSDGTGFTSIMPTRTFPIDSRAVHIIFDIFLAHVV